MPYVIQRPSGYIYRQVIPADLRVKVGKGEVRYSLRERSLCQAKRKAQSITGQLKGLFAEIRKENLTLNQRQINQIIRNIIETTISDMEEQKLTGEPLTRSQLTDRLNDLDIFEHDYKEALSLREYGVIEPFVDIIIKDFKLDVKKGSADYRRLSGEVLKAHIKILEVDRQQSTGDYSYRETLKESLSRDKQGDLPEPESIPVSQIAAEYWNERSKNWSPRTTTEYKKFQDELLGFIGSGGCPLKDSPILSVDWQRGREYKAHLDSTDLSAVRKDNYLMYASALWKWSIKRHYAEINAFDGLQEGKAGRKRADKQRAKFSRDDLQTLFVKSPEYGEGKLKREDYWWLPLLGLFTGCRLEELSQLHVDDVKKLEGVWCLDVNDKEDKRLKAGEQRIVPLHDTLIDLGFLKYVNKQTGKRLFPNFKPISNRYEHSVGRWFSAFKQRMKVDKNKSFHSFRHLV